MTESGKGGTADNRRLRRFVLDLVIQREGILQAGRLALRLLCLKRRVTCKLAVVDIRHVGKIVIILDHDLVSRRIHLINSRGC